LKQNQKTLESNPRAPNNLIPPEGKVAWCCAPPTNPCCPELRLMPDGSFKITDDYGDQITLTESSLKEVIQKVSDFLQ
tara:strand:- start:278 stop:511 length:234 start_codon:yes stop_codon:yes gene_type:complete